MPRWPGFIGGSNASTSYMQDAEKTMNLCVEQSQSQAAKSPAALIGTPGFQQWSSVAVADVGERGCLVANGRPFFVMGANLYEYSSTGVPTKRSTSAMVQDSNPAQLAYNGIVGGQLGVCSGGNVYVLNLATNGWSGPFLVGKATMLAFADGYGLGFDANTGRVYLSALNDFTSWDLGTFFQRSKFSDPALAMFVDPNGLIWHVGSETFEVRYNSGQGTQPWVVLSGLYGRWGIAAPFGYGISNAGLYWLGRSPEGGVQIVTTTGGEPDAISPYAVNTAIAGYLRTQKVSDAEMLIYQDQGHLFVNTAFPTANATWTVDAKTHSYAERGKWNSLTGAYDVWAPRGHLDCFGKHLVGDRTTGNIWWMDTAFATDVDGKGIRRLRRAPALFDEFKRDPIDNLQLVMDTGVAGQGVDPKVMLRTSPNGRDHWSNERQASYGAIGDTLKRVTFNRVGTAPLVVEVSWSDNAPVRVVDALINSYERLAA